MRVLVVTGMYPTAADPVFGRFVRDQVDALRRALPSLEMELLFFDGRASKLNYLRAIREVRARVRRNRYDIVHAHYGLAGLAACCQRLVPVVITLHGSDVAVPWQRALTRLAASRAARLIVVSERLRRRLEGPHPRAASRAVVIPCGIDMERFRPEPRSEARRRLGWPSAGARALFPADPDRPVKGYGLFRETIERLRRLGHDAEVVCLRGVPPERVPLLMSACDLMIMTSVSEGSPMVVKEAMACDLPIVSLDVGDVAEVTRGAVRCEVIPAVDRGSEAAARLAAAAARILDGGGRSDGRERVRHLAQEEVTARVLDVYRSVA